MAQPGLGRPEQITCRSPIPPLGRSRGRAARLRPWYKPWRPCTCCQLPPPPPSFSAFTDSAAAAAQRLHYKNSNPRPDWRNGVHVNADPQSTACTISPRMALAPPPSTLFLCLFLPALLDPHPFRTKKSGPQLNAKLRHGGTALGPLGHVAVFSNLTD